MLLRKIINKDILDLDKIIETAVEYIKQSDESKEFDEQIIISFNQNTTDFMIAKFCEDINNYEKFMEKLLDAEVSNLRLSYGIAPQTPDREIPQKLEMSITRLFAFAKEDDFYDSKPIVFGTKWNEPYFPNKNKLEDMILSH